MNANKLRLASELALAGYGEFASENMTRVLFRANLVNLNGDLNGFALSQADKFVDNFDIAIPTYNDATTAAGGTGQSSFDVTVFRTKAEAPGGANQVHIAMRGTQQMIEAPPSDLLTGDGSFVWKHGAAIDQIVAMFNWWMREGTTAGAFVPQYRLERYTLSSIPAGAVVLGYDTDTSHPAGIISTTALALVRSASVTATGRVRDLLNHDPDAKVTVSGSSMGGHLAMAFAGLFPGQLDEAYAFNSPGFADNVVVRRLFAALGGQIPTAGNSQIFNIFSVEDLGQSAGFSPFARRWSAPGVHLDLAIENQLGTDVPDPKPKSWNHDQRQATDAAALFELLHTLDAKLDLRAFDSLVRSSAPGENRSFENLVDGLSALLLGSVTATPAGNANRNELHFAMERVHTSAAFEDLTGKLRVQTAGGSQNAREDFVAFVGLYTLSPLRLAGVAAVDQQALTTHVQGAWSALHAQWQADRALPDDQRNFSDQWLADRKLMMAGLLQANASNDDNLAALYGHTTIGRLQDVGLDRDISIFGGIGTQVRFGAAGKTSQRASEPERASEPGAFTLHPAGDGRPLLHVAPLADRVRRCRLSRDGTWRSSRVHLWTAFACWPSWLKGLNATTPRPCPIA